jgi:hypothetical protein
MPIQLQRAAQGHDSLKHGRLQREQSRSALFAGVQYLFEFVRNLALCAPEQWNCERVPIIIEP